MASWGQVGVTAEQAGRRDEDGSAQPTLNFALWAAVLLALNAGYINAVGLLSFFNLAVSHVTGSVSNLGIAFAEGDLSQIQTLALVIMSFAAGNVVAGFLVVQEELQSGQRYVPAFLAEAALIVAAILLFDLERQLANYLLAAAMGLQNGLATRYSGATVRTSHMSGVVTDLGILVGRRLAGTSVGRWRAQVLSALLGGFLAGAVVAGIAYRSWGHRVLWISVIGLTVAGISHSRFRPFRAWRSRDGRG